MIKLAVLKEQIICDKKYDNKIKNCKLVKTSYFFRTTADELGNIKSAYFNKYGVFLKTDQNTICLTTASSTNIVHTQKKECLIVMAGENQFMNPEFFYRKTSDSINVFLDNNILNVFDLSRHHSGSIFLFLFTGMIFVAIYLFLYQNQSIKFDKKSKNLSIKKHKNLFFSDEISNFLLGERVVISKDSIFSRRPRGYTIQLIRNGKTTTTLRFYTHSLVSAEYIEQEINHFLA